MTTVKPYISIIIPAYNEEKYIDRTLASIQQLNKGQWKVEIIVVESTSSDATVGIATAFGVTVISTHLRGISVSRQIGVKRAKGEVIVCTDADTIVPPDWLEIIMKELMQPNTAGVFGTYRVVDGQFIYRFWTNIIQPILVLFFYRLLSIPLAPGQNMAFWKKHAVKVGGFDSTMNYMEDIDLAVRLKKSGRVRYLSALCVRSSGRRGKEGWKFFYKRGFEEFLYFILGRKTFSKVENFR